MQIEIKPSEPLSLKLGDRELTLSRPKVGRVREMTKKMKEASGGIDQLNVLSEFCLSCGVPQDVVDEWDMSQLASFISQLASDGQKKT